MRPATRTWSIIGLLLAISLALSTPLVRAPAVSAANGGVAALGDVNSGANAGSAIEVGDTWGDVSIEGGDLANSTAADIAAGGGAGLCDASGGDANLGLNIEPPPASGPSPARDNSDNNNNDNGNDRDRDRDRDRDDDEPEEPPAAEFVVCVMFSAGELQVCGAGECTGPDDNLTCTLEDCSELLLPSPCTFQGCEMNVIQENVGMCEILPELD